MIVFDVLAQGGGAVLWAVLLRVLAVVVVLAMVWVFVYNGHVRRRNVVDHAFSVIDVQLKKRWDLVPPLVETVKGYAAHKLEVLERVVALRGELLAVEDRGQERFAKERVLGEQLGRLVAVAEGYPELRSARQFELLMRNLTEVESQIAAARRTYLAGVMAYNNGVEVFPLSVVSRAHGFGKRDWALISEVERMAPGV